MVDYCPVCGFRLFECVCDLDPDEEEILNLPQTAYRGIPKGGKEKVRKGKGEYRES